MDMGGDSPSSSSPLNATGVDFSNETQAFDFLQEILDDSTLGAIGNQYARYFWYGVVVVIGIASLCNIAQRSVLWMRWVFVKRSNTLRKVFDTDRQLDLDSEQARETAHGRRRLQTSSLKASRPQPPSFESRAISRSHPSQPQDGSKCLLLAMYTSLSHTSPLYWRWCSSTTTSLALSTTRLWVSVLDGSERRRCRY